MYINVLFQAKSWWGLKSYVASTFPNQTQCITKEKTKKAKQNHLILLRNQVKKNFPCQKFHETMMFKLFCRKIRRHKECWTRSHDCRLAWAAQFSNQKAGKNTFLLETRVDFTFHKIGLFQISDKGKLPSSKCLTDQTDRFSDQPKPQNVSQARFEFWQVIWEVALRKCRNNI